MKPARRAQQGFTLIELAVAFALLTVAIVGTLTLSEFAKRIDQGRAVGKHMLELNAAVGRYKSQYMLQLLALPAVCGQSTYRVGTSLPGPVIGANAGIRCQLDTLNIGGNAYQIANAMQPSAADLKALGLLENGFNEQLRLPLDTSRQVARADLTGASSAGVSQYVVLIQRQCQSAVCDPTTGPFKLQSYAFNMQPYRVDQSLFGSGARLGAAIIAMEGKGYLAQRGGDGTLRNTLNQVTVPNPVIEMSGAGAVGIIAAYEGWGSGDEKYTYRDGSRPPTNNWDFNSKDLSNVNALKVQSIDAQGATIGKDKVTKFDPIREDVAGPPSSDQLPFWSQNMKNIITANRGLLVRGNLVTTEQMGVYAHELNAVEDIQAGGNITAKRAFLGGTLTVDSAGISAGLVAGNAQINGRTTVVQLKMDAVKTFGTACTTDVDSFAKNDANYNELLVCHDATWSKMALTKAPVVTPPPPPPKVGKRIKFVAAGSYRASIFLGWGTSSSAQSGWISPGKSWETTLPVDATDIYAQISGISSNGNQVTVGSDEISDDSYTRYGGCYKATGTGKDVGWGNVDMYYDQHHSC